MKKNMQDLRTGDCIFFSSFACNGMFVRIFTSSMWNHVGIAIRIMEDGRISTGPEGKLCILESGSYPRKDILNKSETVGVALVDAHEIISEYVLSSARYIKRSILTDRYATLVRDFIDNHNGKGFASMSPFIAVWLSLPIQRESDNYFCSELAAHFYESCVYPIIVESSRREDHLDGDDVALSLFSSSFLKNEDEKHGSIKKIGLSELERREKYSIMFGENSLHLPQLISPKFLSSDGTPNAPIFLGEHHTIHRREDGASVVLAQHILLAVAVVFLGAMIVKKDG